MSGKIGAPYGNQNAKGNKGNPNGYKNRYGNRGNPCPGMNAFKDGYYAKYPFVEINKVLPEELEIINRIPRNREEMLQQAIKLCNLKIEKIFREESRIMGQADENGMVFFREYNYKRDGVQGKKSYYVNADKFYIKLSELHAKVSLIRDRLVMELWQLRKREGVAVRSEPERVQEPKDQNNIIMLEWYDLIDEIKAA